MVTVLSADHHAATEDEDLQIGRQLQPDCNPQPRCFFEPAVGRRHQEQSLVLPFLFSLVALIAVAVLVPVTHRSLSMVYDPPHPSSHHLASIIGLTLSSPLPSSLCSRWPFTAMAVAQPLQQPLFRRPPQQHPLVDYWQPKSRTVPRSTF